MCRFVVVQDSMHNIDTHVTLCSTYEEFGYNEHHFCCIQIIHNNVRKFHYEEHPFRRSRFFCIFSVGVSGTHCKQDPVQAQLVINVLTVYETSVFAVHSSLGTRLCVFLAFCFASHNP